MGSKLLQYFSQVKFGAWIKSMGMKQWEWRGGET